MPTGGHVGVAEVYVPWLIDGFGFEIVIDCSGVFGGSGTETFEWPAIEVGYSGEVDEGVEVDYS